MDAESTTTEDLGRTYAAVLGKSARPDGAVPAPVVAAAPAEPAEETPPDPLRIIEALLFVAGQPLRAERVCEIIRGLTHEKFIEAVDTLNHDYRRQNRPYTILAQEQGYLLTLRARFHEVPEKVYGGPREARLSTAVIDVLALVAYRQPVTKLQIDALRGGESGPLLRQLVRRGLIQVVYPNAENRRDITYTTSERFLQMFGLESVEDLPRTQDPQQM
jgi:segregation and condensation protein B